MEGAPLRPVPTRPPGAIEAGAAEVLVAERLPALDPTARRVLALVALAGRSHGEAGLVTGLALGDVAAALARGRTELRRAAAPLRGSGWCTRAERLISDRLDGPLSPPGPRRLEVHMRNCPRCVEHERRLVQVLDGLVAELAATAQANEEPAPEPVRPALTIVEEPPEEEDVPVPSDPGMGELALAGPAEDVEALVAAAIPAPPAGEETGPPAQPEHKADAVVAPEPRAAAAPEPPPGPQAEVDPGPPPLPDPEPVREPEPEPEPVREPEPVAEPEPEPEPDPEPAPARPPAPVIGDAGAAHAARAVRQATFAATATALTWNALFALAILLALAAAAITGLGISGGEI